jgi:hypothetical protein
MASRQLPLRLLANIDGNFEVIDTRDSSYSIAEYDILTYTWGVKIKPPYKCSVPGVNWNIMVSEKKLDGIKALTMKGDVKYGGQRLQDKVNVKYLWVDCLCLNQEDSHEKSVEIPKMYEYYKRARTCYVLMDMVQIWEPQELVQYLSFIDHVLHNMGGASLASETGLSMNVKKRLSEWGTPENWSFPLDYTLARSANIDIGLLNCYSTCISRVTDLFDNEYFTRVWTFQEMLLGKNITIYGANGVGVSCIGELQTWSVIFCPLILTLKGGEDDFATSPPPGF